MQVLGFNECGSIDILLGDHRLSVPDEADNRFRQDIAAWEREGNTIPPYKPPPVSAAEVKAECRRRILAIMSEDQQRNTLAAGQAATMQFGADPTRWPAELQARQAAAMAAWAEIERLRARSNEIEAMDPIPADVVDDGLWEPIE